MAPVITKEYQRDVESAISGIYRTSDYFDEQKNGKDQTEGREQPWKRYIDEISVYAQQERGHRDEAARGDRYQLSEGYDDHSS